MAVTFNDLTAGDSEKLSNYVTKLLVGDLIKEQEELVIASLEDQKLRPNN